MKKFNRFLWLGHVVFILIYLIVMTALGVNMSDILAYPAVLLFLYAVSSVICGIVSGVRKILKKETFFFRTLLGSVVITGIPIYILIALSKKSIYLPTFLLITIFAAGSVLAILHSIFYSRIEFIYSNFINLLFGTRTRMIISVCVLSVIIIASAFSAAFFRTNLLPFSRSSNVEYRTVYINVKDDVDIKERADVKSKTMDSIPYGEPVSLVETKKKELTINGVTAKWSKIKWNGKTGWVFCDLSESKPEDASIYSNFIRKINDAKDGEVIKIAGGKFFVDETGGLVLEGIKDVTIKSSTPGNPAELVSASPDQDIVRIHNCKNLTVDGFVIYHDVESGCVASCVSVENSESVTVTGCDIHGSGAYGINVPEETGNSHIYITSNKIHNCSIYGLYYSSEKGSITGNTFYDNAENMFVDENIKYKIEMAENNLYLNTTALGDFIGEYEGTKEEDGNGEGERIPTYRMSITKSEYNISFDISESDGSYLVSGDLVDLSVNSNEYVLKIKSPSDAGTEYEVVLVAENNSTDVRITDFKNLGEEETAKIRDKLETGGYLDSFHRTDIDYGEGSEGEPYEDDEAP
jgi:hypothetical protein